MINAKVIELLEKLEGVRGRNAKIKIIQENEGTTDFILYLKAALNPYEIYNIGKIVQPEGFNQTEKFEHMFDMTEYLSQKKGLNNQDLANVYFAINELDAITQKWIRKAILKKSIAGIGAKTVNKALGYNVIPIFELMLMHNNEKDYKGIKFPILAEPKVDGFRCIKFPGKIFLGRSGKPLANSRFNEHVQIDDSLEFKENQVVLDGEAYSHGRDFNSLASILSSEDKEIPKDVKFVVFSAIPLQEWNVQKGITTYKEQMEFIENTDWEGTCKNVVPITGITVNSIEELEEYYKEVTNEGYEGVVVKNPDEPYYWKRVTVASGICQKIKPEEFIDGEIVDYYEGEDDYKGMLGGFVARLESGVLVGVGSGLSLIQRQKYWDGRDLEEIVDKEGEHTGWKPIGPELSEEETREYFNKNHLNKWIEIKYMNITPEGSLRHPIFKRFRDDK
jgi:ATP-dependent DNA ligase